MSTETSEDHKPKAVNIEIPEEFLGIWKKVPEKTKEVVLKLSPRQRFVWLQNELRLTVYSEALKENKAKRVAHRRKQNKMKKASRKKNR